MKNYQRQVITTLVNDTEVNHRIRAELTQGWRVVLDRHLSTTRLIVLVRRVS
jgi:hypothetical protein